MKHLLIFCLSSLFSLAPVSANDSLDRLKQELAKRLQEESVKRKNSRSPQTTEKPGLICDAQARTGLCYTFTGSNNLSKNNLKGNEMACKLMRGMLVKNSTCPSSNALGRCTIKAGTADEYSLTYYKNKISKTKAHSDCLNAKSSLHRHGAGNWQAY